MFVPQRCLLLADDLVGATPSAQYLGDRITIKSDVLQGHHDGLVPRLLPVGRTARCLLSLLALEASKLVSTLSTSLDTLHSLLVVGLDLLLRAQNLGLGEESVGVVGALDVLLGRLESCQFALGRSGRSGVDQVFGGLQAELVEQSKVGRREDLRSALVCLSEAYLLLGE